MKFPAEIRNHIYKYVLEDNDHAVLKFVPKSHFDHFGSNWSGDPDYYKPDPNDLVTWDLVSNNVIFPIGLFRACRQVCNEVVPLAYGSLRICLILTDFDEPWFLSSAMFENGSTLRLSKFPKARLTKLHLFVWPRRIGRAFEALVKVESTSATLKDLRLIPALQEVSCCVVIQADEDEEDEERRLYNEYFSFAHESESQEQEIAKQISRQAADMRIVSDKIRKGLDMLRKQTFLVEVVSMLIQNLPNGVSCCWTDGFEHDSLNDSIFVAHDDAIKASSEPCTENKSAMRKRAWFRDITGPRDGFLIVPKNVLEALQP